MDMGLKEFIGHNNTSLYDHIMNPFFDELDSMDFQLKKNLYEAIDKNFLIITEKKDTKVDLSVYYPYWKFLMNYLGKSFTEGNSQAIWQLYDLGNLSLGDVIKKFVLQSIICDGKNNNCDVNEYENILSVINILNTFETKKKHGFDKDSIKIILNKLNLSEFDFFDSYGYMLSQSQLEKALIKSLNNK